MQSEKEQYQDSPDYAGAATAIIKEKLGRIIKTLVKVHQQDGRLSPDDQQTIRLLESRQRLVDRTFRARWGSTEQDRQDALTELRFSQPDDGTLIQIGEKRHGRGRLDCRACAIEYQVVGGVSVPVRLAGVCRVCGDGVRHVYRVEESIRTPQYPAGIVRKTATESNLTSKTSSQDGTLEEFYRADPVRTLTYYQCESCGASLMTVQEPEAND